MKRAVLLIGLVIVTSGLLNLGAIRKKEDPILKTQTDSISYQKKEEEMKDGPKGAPMPSFNLYPKARFLSDPAVGEAKEEEPQPESAKEQISEVPVDIEESEDWWGEEDAASSDEEAAEFDETDETVS